MQLLEINSMILMLGNRLRDLSKVLSQTNGDRLTVLVEERDQLLRQYADLCKTAATLTA